MKQLGQLKYQLDTSREEKSTRLQELQIKNQQIHDLAALLGEVPYDYLLFITVEEMKDDASCPHLPSTLTRSFFCPRRCPLRPQMCRHHSFCQSLQFTNSCTHHHSHNASFIASAHESIINLIYFSSLYSTSLYVISLYFPLI